MKYGKEGSSVWERLGKILPERALALGLGRGLSPTGVCAEFDRLAHEILGDDAPVEAISFVDGKLRVEARGGIWATELRLRLPQIGDELNKKLRDSAISEIKLRVR